jgi:uncharacterized protein (TIGR02270 family)
MATMKAMDVQSDQEVLPTIVDLHCSEVANLRVVRGVLCGSPHISVFLLRRHDDRIAAHLDGLLVAGNAVQSLSDGLDADSFSETVFPLAVVALIRNDRMMLERLMRIGHTAPSAVTALKDAFAWVDSATLRGLVTTLLPSTSTLHRVLGLAACGSHGVDAGVIPFVSDADATVRAQALRVIGELGRRESLTVCAAAAGDEDIESRFWGAKSALLLGDRNAALHALIATVEARGPHSAECLRLVVQALRTETAHAFLQQLARSPRERRWLIHGSGIAGDPAYVPWLLEQMTVPHTARVAAEAFMTMTGLDLFQGFEMPRPIGLDSGPMDDPEDEDIQLDPDEGLPWPDQEKIKAWWDANRARFVPGQRYFMGAPVTREHCIEVLKTGYQRQRILAAHYLCLLEPGTPLFNTSAPAWRQQRLLAEMK